MLWERSFHIQARERWTSPPSRSTRRADKARPVGIEPDNLYNRSGPVAAAVVGRSDVARAVVRTLLGPVVDVARIAAPIIPK